MNSAEVGGVPAEVTENQRYLGFCGVVFAGDNLVRGPPVNCGLTISAAPTVLKALTTLTAYRVFDAFAE